MIVLSVNGEAIEDAAIQQEAAAVLNLITPQMQGEEPQVLKARAREWAEENLIEAALMRQAALSDPEPLTDCPPESEATVRLERLIARITSQTAAPRRKDVVAFYMKNRDTFDEPEKIRAAHIIKNIDEQNTEEIARAAIERVRDELAKNRPFAEVADEQSDCPGKGGELAPFSRGDMVPAFEEVVFNLEVNQVSGIFRTEFGFHIATLLERFPAGIRPLEAVYDQIEKHLLQEKNQKKLHQYIDTLRARAVIERKESPAR